MLGLIDLLNINNIERNITIVYLSYPSFMCGCMYVSVCGMIFIIKKRKQKRK